MRVLGIILAMSVFSVYPALCFAILLATAFFAKPDIAE